MGTWAPNDPHLRSRRRRANRSLYFKHHEVLTACGSFVMHIEELVSEIPESLDGKESAAAFFASGEEDL